MRKGIKLDIFSKLYPFAYSLRKRKQNKRDKMYSLYYINDPLWA